MTQVPFKIRDVYQSDIPFIYSTWLKGLRYGNEVFGLIEKTAYFENQHKVIETILNRFDTEVSIACVTDEPEVILGYAAYMPGGIVHYVHVKDAFRRFGIAKALLPNPVNRVTHITKIGWSILKEKHPQAIFNPYL